MCCGEWVRPVVKKLDDLLSLPQNWDSYGAPEISNFVVPAVIDFLQKIMLPSTPIPQIVPTNMGGVQLEWHQNGIDLEIEFKPTGEIEGWDDRIPGVLGKLRKGE